VLIFGKIKVTEMNRRASNKEMREELIGFLSGPMAKEAAITRIEYEGPTLAVYTENPNLLSKASPFAKELAKHSGRRVEVRADPSIRLPVDAASKRIREMLPRNVAAKLLFNQEQGQVTVEVDKVTDYHWTSDMAERIVKETLWKARVVTSPFSDSQTVHTVRDYLYASAERPSILRRLGERIFRPQVFETGGVRITMLGGAQQVGRSSIMVETTESKVLLDFGIDPHAENNFERLPRIDARPREVLDLDAVVISHAHLDHSGAVPYLFKYNYDGPVFALEPTVSLSTLLQRDYLNVAARRGEFPPYSEQDVRDALLHTIPIEYHRRIRIAPDLALTAHNAGHILGSAMLHLDVGDGSHGILYTGDFRFGRTQLLDPAEHRFSRLDTLIIESTYGRTPVPLTRAAAEATFAAHLRRTLQRGGSALVPVPAIGRAQEILIVLRGLLRRGLVPEVPVFVDGLINEATAIHTAYPRALSRRIREEFDAGVNPFASDYFTPVTSAAQRQELLGRPEPAIILSSSGMLEGGPVLEYLRALSGSDANLLLFVSHQARGTVGSQLVNGEREIMLTDESGRRRVLRVNMEREKVEGFSGHSSREQLVHFLTDISPKPRKIIVGHGDPEAVESFARTAAQIMPATIYTPKTLEALSPA